MKSRTSFTVFLFVCSLLTVQFSSGQLPKETEAQKAERMKWWTDSRFGMFIHWGLYSLPAHDAWAKSYEKLSNEQYQKYFEVFNPDMFDPHEWAKAAKATGMKYVVLTAKHHEGFCLFDSKFTDYKSTNTPCGKDLVKEYVDAFRAEGLKIGFYYSLVDWHHPDYTIDKYHPLRPDSDSSSAYARLNKGRDMKKYQEYLKNQVRELLTNYGEISIMWFDFSFPEKNGKGHADWDAENLLKMVRKLQPGIIVDDRLDLSDVEGGWDFVSPEQETVPKWPEVNGKRVPWEICQTFANSWGYYRDDSSWKNSAQLLELLIGSVSKGGNLLLNVGPTARGVFDYRAQDRLKSIGDWMKFNNRSVYGCTAAPEGFTAPANSLLTYNPATKRLYIHLLAYPMGSLTLTNMADMVKYIQFLHDASEIKFSRGENENKNNLILQLPVQKPSTEIPVLEVYLK